MGDITSAYTNSAGSVSIPVAAYAAAIPTLGTASWRLQVRASPGNGAQALLDLSTANGGASYAAGVVTFMASAAQMARIPAGTYTYDFGFTLPGQDFLRIDGGNFVVNQGITRA